MANSNMELLRMYFGKSAKDLTIEEYDALEEAATTLGQHPDHDHGERGRLLKWFDSLPEMNGADYQEHKHQTPAWRSRRRIRRFNRTHITNTWAEAELRLAYKAIATERGWDERGADIFEFEELLEHYLDATVPEDPQDPELEVDPLERADTWTATDERLRNYALELEDPAPWCATCGQGLENDLARRRRICATCRRRRAITRARLVLNTAGSC